METCLIIDFKRSIFKRETANSSCFSGQTMSRPLHVQVMDSLTILFRSFSFIMHYLELFLEICIFKYNTNAISIPFIWSFLRSCVNFKFLAYHCTCMSVSTCILRIYQCLNNTFLYFSFLFKSSHVTYSVFSIQ